MKNGEWEMGNGTLENVKRRKGNGKWGMGNGKWKMGNEKWEMGNDKTIPLLILNLKRRLIVVDAGFKNWGISLGQYPPHIPEF